MDEQQQILAMILDAKAAGKNEDEIVEMLREARDAQYKQGDSISENAPEPPASEHYEEIYAEIDEEIYEEIDEKYDEIEWIFPDEEVNVQNEQLIETSPVSVVSDPSEHSNEWENRLPPELTLDTSLESAMDSPSGLAIVKTSQLQKPPLSQRIAQKRNNPSPLAILGAFVFLGAVIGVTLYQFFRLQPKPPNIAQDATVEPPNYIASDPPAVESDNSRPPAVSPKDPLVRPSENLPPGCGAYSGSREAQIVELNTSRTALGGFFPVVCQSQLNELQFKYAIEKLAANDGDFQAAATMLCDVTETYFKNEQDPFRRPFFRDWSEINNNFKVWLEKYLASGDCPAANYLQ